MTFENNPCIDSKTCVDSFKCRFYKIGQLKYVRKIFKENSKQEFKLIHL